MNTDPIADMCARLRNAVMAGNPTVSMPASKTKIGIARILAREGLIGDCEVEPGSVQDTLKIDLKYDEERRPALSGLKRVSKPGLRIYSGARDIPKVMGGVGIAVISTSQGLMTGREAYRRRIGGEVMCYAW
ncbi:MAG: 30S ribosomal protein S8 [Chloroflexi bacterium]|nr:30S ribosomal protein S8 [Chloroflexota bacterium]MCY3937734.1 30S ribosomal protein S8 [Chloroflexota bacterium]